MARQLEDPTALVDVLLARANLRWTAETYDEAIALAEEALALPGLNALQKVVGHTRRAVPLIASGRLTEGNAAFATAIAIAHRANLIGPSMQLAQQPAARAALTTSSSGLEVPWTRLFGDTVEAEVRAGLPADAVAEALAARLVPHADLVATAGTAYWWGPVGLSLALLEARLGRVAQAQQRLREVAERANTWGTTAWAVRARAHLKRLDARAAQR